MIRPESAPAYDEIDLKLGIKSSLSAVKPTLALLFLMWREMDRPSDLEYSVAQDTGIVLRADIETKLHQKLVTLEPSISLENFRKIVNNNHLFKAQLEALLVAFELIWKVAKIRFADGRANSAERTGGRRFQKKIWFTINMDLLDAVCADDEDYTAILFSWLGFSLPVDSEKEVNIIRFLTAISETAYFKLVDDGKDIVFNLESVYKAVLAHEEPIDISGDQEAKGALRILKSALTENLFYHLNSNNGSVTSENHDVLQRYAERVETYHRLNPKMYYANPASETTTNASETTASTTGGKNIILYGVPGCGKSHTIKTEYCDNEDLMKRVVFHPDYTYSDFVGQILPKTDGERISYPFIEGPFTTILRKAIQDPDNPYYLVIEEINRGNAPAIFGDLFQLLDRKNGESEYGITNFDIAKCVYGEGNEETKIKIPANLTILATMNTADQNVFTLDTAFKRRWIMRSIENDIYACHHADNLICGTNIKWGLFATTINELIIDLGKENLSSEDNRLGAYFVQEGDLLDEKIFAEKVLLYLWNDVFKYDRDKVFKPEYRTLEELLKGFYAHKFDVFVSSLGFDSVAAPVAIGGGLHEDEYLTSKNPDMVALYKTICDKMRVQIPDLTTYTTPSKAYIGLCAGNSKKKNFAEFMIKKASIFLEIEKPTDVDLQDMGVELKYDGSHDHYFRIVVTQGSDLDMIVAAIIESYTQLQR